MATSLLHKRRLMNACCALWFGLWLQRVFPYAVGAEKDASDTPVASPRLYGGGIQTCVGVRGS